MKYLLFATAHLYTDHPTGGIRRYRELSEYMKSNSDVTVCSFDDSQNMNARGFKNHVHIEKGKMNGLYKLLPPIFRIFFANRKVLNELSKEHFDKVVAFDISPTTALILWGFSHITMLIRMDSIGYERVIFKGSPLIREIKCSLLWIWELLCVLKVDRIITQCKYDRNVIQHRHPLLSAMIGHKTKIQINNVNPSWISCNDTVKTEFIKLPLNDSFKVCFIGGFSDSRKGQDIFLEAAKKILKKDNQFEFILIGGGSDLNKYKKEYENPKIQFLGRLTNPVNVLKQCNLLVVPSLADSCPNTVMEALYNDVLVIGSKRGGIPEILLDEVSLFELDSQQLEKKIIELKNDKQCMAHMVALQQKRKKALTFNWAIIISELI